MLGFKKNVNFSHPLKLSSWRKAAIGTWHAPGDPTVYGMMEINVEAALKYIDHLREKTGEKITLTHFMGRIIAVLLVERPELNSILRLGRLYKRRDIDIFFQVATDTLGEDLSGTTIRQADKKTTTEIAKEMNLKVTAIKNKKDQTYTKVKNSMSKLPGFLCYLVVNFLGFILYTLNIWHPLLGAPRDSFGSSMITNIGSLGLDSALAPLVPYSRVSSIVVMGQAKLRPWVDPDGKLTTAQTMMMTASFDHRVIDGMHASHMVKRIKDFFEHPEKIDI